MDLVYSVAAFAAMIVLYTIVLVGTRRREPSFWASEGMVGNVWCILMTGLIAYGVALAARFALTWPEQPFGLREAVMVAAIVVACVAVVRLIAPRRRLAAYAAAEAVRTGAVASNVVSVGTFATANPPPQAEPPRDPDMHRAA